MNVLILGYGSIARKHHKILSKLKPVQNIYICSNSYTKKNKIEYDKRSIIKLNPDYVIIASDTNLHYKHLIFLNKILKNKIFLVEKPIFHKKVKKIMRLNNRVFVGYNLRFDPIILFLKSFFDKQKLKSLLTVNVYCGSYLPKWRKNIKYNKSYSGYSNRGGGVALDLSHEIDYLNWIFGDFIIINKIYNKVSNLKIESNDFFNVIGSFKNNKKNILNISLNYFSKIDTRFLIIESNDYTCHANLINRNIKIRNKSRTIVNKYFKIQKDFTYIEMHKNIINGSYQKLSSYKEATKVVSMV